MTHGARYRGSGHDGVPVDRHPGAADRLPPDSRVESVRLRVTGVAWTALWEAVRRTPDPVAHAFGRAAGATAYWVAGATRRQVRRNLARVVGPGDHLEAEVRAVFCSYARYWVESFRAADLDEAAVDARTTTQGFVHLDDALDEGKGAIVLLAHHGSWDMAARWAESHGYHLAVVAEVVRPRALFRRFVRLRESVGLEVVPLGRGPAAGPDGTKGGGVSERLAAVLAANHLVGLLSDRDLSRRAPTTELFGHPARIPSGAIALARRTGAPIVPITMRQLPGRRWHLHALERVIVDDVPVEQARARVARALEAIVRTAPNQWYAFSPIWTDDPKARPPRSTGRSTACAVPPSARADTDDTVGS